MKTTIEVCEYIDRTYTYGEDTKIALETLTRPTLAMPEDPAEDATQTARKIWEEQIKQYMRREDTLAQNLKSTYALIDGQCSDTLHIKLESRPDYEGIKTTANPIGLLENIKVVMYQFQAKQYGPLALHEAKCHYYTFYQDKNTTCQQYYESFKNNTDVLEYAGGTLSWEPALMDAELEAASVIVDFADENELAAAEAAARERVLAIGLLVGSDCRHYGKLLEDLKNDFTQGHNNYPATLQQVYSLLVHWKQDPHNIVHLISGTNDSVAFTNVGTETSDQGGNNSQTGDGRVEHCHCYNCGEVGHISHDCTQERAGETNLLPTQLLMQGVEDLITNDSYQFAQSDGHLPRSWIIIDTGSMVNVFSNKSLLKNVRATNRYMWIRCNAGWSYTNQMGELPGYPSEVWYNPWGIANILCFADVCNHFHVRFNSTKQGTGFPH